MMWHVMTFVYVTVGAGRAGGGGRGWAGAWGLGLGSLLGVPAGHVSAYLSACLFCYVGDFSAYLCVCIFVRAFVCVRVDVILRYSAVYCGRY